MWTTLAGLNWTVIAGVIGSVTPLITVLIAYRALGSWKRTLQNQRVDECISAAYDLIGSLEEAVRPTKLLISYWPASTISIVCTGSHADIVPISTPMLYST
jgi:hypothetical protein